MTLLSRPSKLSLLLRGRVRQFLFAIINFICYNRVDMVQVTRKDEREANENILRRFNRRLLQSGVLAKAKSSQRFEKDISKPERRKKAIIRRERRAEKAAKMRLGVR